MYKNSYPTGPFGLGTVEKTFEVKTWQDFTQVEEVPPVQRGL